jgi:hypothetical protein
MDDYANSVKAVKNWASVMNYFHNRKKKSQIFLLLFQVSVLDNLASSTPRNLATFVPKFPVFKDGQIIDAQTLLKGEPGVIGLEGRVSSATPSNGRPGTSVCGH